jgi:polysaccharide pyruvyl transferase WcaK-like protein
VKPRVVWRKDYWLTDFATSVYKRSAGLFGNEQHSPILCIAQGIPAIVCRYREQTSKGFMWRDLGMGEWLFDHDHDEAKKGLTPAVLALAQDPAAARSKALRAKALADERMKRMMTQLRAELER